MKPRSPKNKLSRAKKQKGGKTRPPEAPLDPVLSDSFREVQPPGFKDHPRSAIEAAAVDTDVDDSIGGE